MDTKQAIAAILLALFVIPLLVILADNFRRRF
jgi:hypothetical protein